MRADCGVGRPDPDVGRPDPDVGRPDPTDPPKSETTPAGPGNGTPRPEADDVCLPEILQRPPCQELCPETRRVGPCPSEADRPVIEREWSIDRLLGRARTTSRLGNYCTYEWKSTELAPTASRFPRDSKPDCAVAVQAPLDTLPLHDDFMIGTGASHVGALPPSPTTPVPVMVAVVDTAINVQKPLGNFHGEAMASIVHDVGCGSDTPATCPVKARSFLGLPMHVAGTPGIHTGYAGTQSDLAKGIHTALAAWEKGKHQGLRRLVVNLSVGWETACDPSPSDGPMKVALEDAATAGALVLAASGNLPLGACVNGPTAPAAWEQGIGTQTTPLVHGVTPVDDRLSELFDHRPLSNTMLAARGSAAILGDRALAGSSVSTAVASAIAARVWSEHPDLTPEEVVQRMWTGGQSRNPITNADSYFGINPPEQRVVSACRAVACARTWLGSTCDTSACPSPTGDTHHAWLDVITPVSKQVLPNKGTPYTFECPDCQGSSMSTLLFGVPWTPVQGNPWVVPQPDVPVCSVCGITGNTASLQIDNQSYYVGLTVDKTIITLKNRNNQTKVLVYTGLLLTIGSWYTLVDDEFTEVEGLAPTSGYINITFTNPPAFPSGNNLVNP